MVYRHCLPFLSESLGYKETAFLSSLFSLLLASMIAETVNVFYEPGPAPPPIPLLSAEVPLGYDQGMISLAANEELHPKVPKSTHRDSKRHTDPRKATRSPGPSRRVVIMTPAEEESSRRRAKSRSASPRRSPAPQYHRGRHSRQSTPQEAPHAADDDPDSDPDSDLASNNSEPQESIPKPPGGPGRPESGGYNIQAALQWSPATFIRLRVGDYFSIILGLTFPFFQDRTHALMDTHFDVNKTYSDQTDRAKQKVREIVSCSYLDWEHHLICLFSLLRSFPTSRNMSVVGPSMT